MGMTPMSVFRRRMEISFASFLLLLIRRETEATRSLPVRSDFGKGKHRKGATTAGRGGGTTRRTPHGLPSAAVGGTRWCAEGAAAGAAEGWRAGREGDGGGAARTGRRSVVVRITAKRHRPIFLPPARTKRQLVSLLLREYRTFNLPAAVR
jgi:hypothetical protein